MDIQINGKFVKAKDIAVSTKTGASLMITPPLDEDYWVLRIPVSDIQAIVAFPKFMTIGIGFQIEEDWNTNLPYRCSAEEIYDHIKRNKGDKRITKAKCIKAIEALQSAIDEQDLVKVCWG